MPEISGPSQPPPPPSPPLGQKPSEIQISITKEKGQDGAPDFFKIVWFALYSSLEVNQQGAQIHVKELEVTQDVEYDTNQVLGSYQYTTISSSDMHSSWNPYFAQVSETNDRIQAQINITQNTAAVEQQTGQVQQTNINTAIQDAAQALQLGYGIAKEIAAITQQISTI